MFADPWLKASWHGLLLLAAKHIPNGGQPIAKMPKQIWDVAFPPAQITLVWISI